TQVTISRKPNQLAGNSAWCTCRRTLRAPVGSVRRYEEPICFWSSTPSPRRKPLSLFGSADFLRRPLCRLLCRLGDAEVLELFAALECCGEPARRQSPAGPGFVRIFRIAIFRGNRAACAHPEPFGR